MEVDQKHITTIRMHETKGSVVGLKKIEGEYHLRLSSTEHVVNISLSLADVRKLCQELVQLDAEENLKHVVPAQEYRSLFFRSSPQKVHDTMADVFTQMAREVFERRFATAFAGANGDS